MRRAFLFAFLVILSGATGPRAQIESSGDSPPVELPDSIVVTANRFGLTPAKTIWPVQVVGQREIEREVSLPHALDGVSGTDIREYNGMGSVSTLSSWGVFNRQMLLLYNGRVVKDYSLGGFNLSEFSPSEFERIEIVKGPQSAFYGADAVGGVVNLISRSALVDRMEVTTRYGSHDLRQYRADISRRLGRIGLGGFGEFAASANGRANAGAERTLAGARAEFMSRDERHYGNISARYFKDSLGVPGPTPDPAFVPVYGNLESNSLHDHQQDENYSLDARYGFHDRDLGRFEIDLFWEKKNLDYQGLYNYESYYYAQSGPDDSTLNIDSVDVRSKTVYDKRSAGVSSRYMKEMSRISLSGGVDWLSGSVRVTGSDSSLGTNLVGPYAPYQYDYASESHWSEEQNQLDTWAAAIWDVDSRLRLDVSGRLQFIGHRSTQPSFNLGAIVRPSSLVSFKLAFGYAFRLPTIAEQFADETYTAGNSHLSPETSRSLVGTMSLTPGQEQFSMRFSVFHQRVDSLIQYVYDPSIYRSVPENVDKFRSTGLDISADLNPYDPVSLGLGLVYQKAEQTLDGHSAFEKANYVPDLKWRARVDADINERLSAGLSVLFTDKRQLRMYDGSLKRLNSVYELGASMSTDINSHLTLVIGGDDLTDERRPDQFGFTSGDYDYPGVGRRFYLKAVASLL